MLKLIRFNVWWNAVVPQVLGWMYFAWLIDPSNARIHWNEVILFFIALISISSFGYLLNDFFDIAADSISGKTNLLGRFNRTTRMVWVIIPLIVGIIAWISLPVRPGASILFAFQIVSLIAYSAPPLRFKQKGILGVFTDAFYGHVNPVFITLTTFMPGYTSESFIGLAIFTIIFCGIALKGVRNILLHQIEDRKKDCKSFTATFVVKSGALYSLNLINRLLPVEAFFTVCICIIISSAFPPFFLSILLFSLLTYLKFSGWKLNYLPKRQLKFKFLYFLNDYYEGWIPVFFLLMLCVNHHEFLFLLALHLVLFPSFITKLWIDFKTIKQNFKTEEDY